MLVDIFDVREPPKKHKAVVQPVFVRSMMRDMGTMILSSTTTAPPPPQLSQDALRCDHPHRRRRTQEGRAANTQEGHAKRIAFRP